MTNGFLFNLGLNIIVASNLTFQDFWIFYRLICAISFFSSILSLAVLILRKRLFKDHSCLKPLEFASEFILPIIGHIGFMPILTSLLTIFSCKEGSTDKILDSFLTQDCSQNCYSGDHIYYSIGSTFAIFFHLLFFIYLRPFWELSQPSLHIHTSARYLSALSIFQVILALVKLNLDNQSQEIYGFCLAGVIFAFIIFTIRIKAYNYERAKVFQIFTLLIALWAIGVSTVNLMVKYPRQIEISMPIGFGAIIFIGIRIAGRYPNRFLSDDAEAVPSLIQFQFTRDFEKFMSKTIYRGSIKRNTNLRRNTAKF